MGTARAAATPIPHTQSQQATGYAPDSWPAMAQQGAALGQPGLSIALQSAATIAAGL